MVQEWGNSGKLRSRVSSGHPKVPLLFSGLSFHVWKKWRAGTSKGLQVLTGTVLSRAVRALATAPGAGIGSCWMDKRADA